MLIVKKDRNYSSCSQSKAIKLTFTINYNSPSVFDSSYYTMFFWFTLQPLIVNIFNLPRATASLPTPATALFPYNECCCLATP